MRAKREVHRELDGIDLALVRLLQANGRISMTEYGNDEELNEGDQVSFEVVSGQKGLQARNVVRL